MARQRRGDRSTRSGVVDATDDEAKLAECLPKTLACNSRSYGRIGVTDLTLEATGEPRGKDFSLEAPDIPPVERLPGHVVRLYPVRIDQEDPRSVSDE